MATTRRRTSRNHGYGNQMKTLHEKAAARPARRNSTVRMPAVAGNPTRDENARNLADDLVLFIESDGGMHDLVQATRKNLINKKARGVYDISKAVKAWTNVANKGAQEYHRQVPNLVAAGWPSHGSYGAFSPTARNFAGLEMFGTYESAAHFGEYDYLLAKKYRPTSPTPAQHAAVQHLTGVRSKPPTPRPKRKNKTLSVSENMGHYPRTKAGRKGTDTWFIFDIFAGRGVHISTRIKKITRAKAHLEAGALVGHKLGRKIVRKVELAGPYSRKPTAKTARK